MEEALFLSVVIPAHGRPERLLACLDALARQDLPLERFEVIVVDDGSPEPVAEVVAPLRERLALTVLRQVRTGPARARNAGAARARGALLVFTDDDCAPEPGWLRELAEAALREPGAGLGGRTRNALPQRLCSEASQMLIDHLYEVFNPDSRDARFFTSNNLALPSEGFQRIGGFAESFPLPAGEDRELCDRWRHEGGRLVYAPDAEVRHFHALRLFGYLRQHFRYGRGAHEFRRLCRERGARVRFEGVSFYIRLVLRPFARERSGRALALAALLLLSQAANAAGLAWQSASSRRSARASAERG